MRSFGTRLLFASCTLVAARVAYAQTSTDLWDVSQGAFVTAHSGMSHGDPANMFGSVSGGPEPSSTLFRDDRPAGFTHWIEWSSARTILLTGMHLESSDDDAFNPGDRGFTQFRLYARLLGSTAYSLLHTFDPPTPHPYGLIDETFTLGSAVTAQDFRAEFDQYAPNDFPGPRIQELDAIATPVPEPTTMAVLGLGSLGALKRRKKR